jgi:hypothetical protein
MLNLFLRYSAFYFYWSRLTFQRCVLSPPSTWRWRQYAPLKRRLTSPIIHCAMSQNAHIHIHKIWIIFAMYGSLCSCSLIDLQQLCVFLLIYSLIFLFWIYFDSESCTSMKNAVTVWLCNLSVCIAIVRSRNILTSGRPLLKLGIIWLCFGETWRETLQL